MSKIYQKPYPAGKNAGFTLIELLVVVLIIGILAAVALPQYEQAVAKSRTMRVLPLLRSISDAENVYYMANGTYSLDFSELDISMPPGAKTVSASRVEYEDFYCILRKGKSGDNEASTQCISTKNQFPNLEKYFNRSYFICWPKTDKDVKICQNLSGRKIGDIPFGSNLNVGYSFQ